MPLTPAGTTFDDRPIRSVILVNPDGTILGGNGLTAAEGVFSDAPIQACIRVNPDGTAYGGSGLTAAEATFDEAPIISAIQVNGDGTLVSGALTAPRTAFDSEPIQSVLMVDQNGIVSGGSGLTAAGRTFDSAPIRSIVLVDQTGASLPLLATTPGGITGWSAVYRAGTAGDSPSQFTDYSGNGLHATQSVAANQLGLATSINGLQCFRSPSSSIGVDTERWFTFPAGLSLDRQNCGIYFVGRTRSAIPTDFRIPLSMGPGLTDLLVELSATNVAGTPTVSLFGTVEKDATTLVSRSGLSVFILSGSAAGVTLRLNGIQQVVSAFSSGSITGGTLGTWSNHTKNWFGEIYEVGFLPRSFTANNMTALEADAVLRYARPLSPSKQVVFAGDSITEGFDAAPLKGWAALLDTNLGASWQHLSQGVLGDTLSAMAATARANGLKGTYDATKAKHVGVLAGGTNDIAVSGHSSAQLLADAQTWLTAMTGAGWSCLVCTILPRADAAWTAAMETTRLAYNSGLSGLTGITTIVDVANATNLTDPNNATYYNAANKIHPTTAGHAAFAPVVQAAILAV